MRTSERARSHENKRIRRCFRAIASVEELAPQGEELADVGKNGWKNATGFFTADYPNTTDIVADISAVADIAEKMGLAPESETIRRNLSRI